MKAIRLEQTGGPEHLAVRDYPTPSPGRGEVLVQVAAAGVNYIDVYHRTGLYKMAPPIPMGLEGAGVIAEVGPEVFDFRVGDRVAWTSAPGSYASHVVVRAERAVPVPLGVETTVAAALLLQGLTAHYLAHSTFPLRAGHTALVHAAAGGVGLLLVQIARRAGARVLATVSTDSKAALARDAGAHEVILYGASDFSEQVLALTGGNGVDVVYDAVGKTTFDGSVRSLAPRGYLVLYGQASGRVEAVDPALLAQRSLFLTRPSLLHYIATREDLLARANDLFAWVASGALRVRIERTYALSEAADAHRALEARLTTGKVLLLP